MNISRGVSAGTLSMSQSRYAQKVIDRVGLGSARGQPTPMDPTVDLKEHSMLCSEECRAARRVPCCHWAIGPLVYHMVGTCRDLAYCIALKRGALARYVIHTKHCLDLCTVQVMP